MKRMTEDEIVEVVKSFKEGKEIEFTSCEAYRADEWYPCSHPVWNFQEMRYRVKPSVEIPPHIYAVFDDEGRVICVSTKIPPSTKGKLVTYQALVHGDDY